MIASKSAKKENANLLTFIGSEDYKDAAYDLNIAHAVGLDEMGNEIVFDLTQYPHALICGTTGSGKTMAVLALLINLLRKYEPKQLRFIIGDKAGELTIFNGVPHLACPIITDFSQLYIALQALVREMDRRTKLKENNRNIRFPYIVLLIDEFPSFISGNEEEKKEACRLLEDILGKGRHTQIHVVLVASNPTKKNIKIDITNLPTKLIFRVARLCYSTSILGVGGAEKLSRKGEMLFQSPQSADIKKIQGFYISPKDLSTNLDEIKSLWEKDTDKHNPDRFFKIDLETMATPQLSENISTTSINQKNKQLVKIIIWVLQRSSISVNQIMENFHIGWSKANKVMSTLENLGIVDELEAKLPRKVCDAVTQEALEILRNSGCSDEEIGMIIQKHSTSNCPNSYQE